MIKNLYIIIILLIVINHSYSQDDLLHIKLTLVDSIESPRYKITPVFEVKRNNQVYRSKRKYNIKVPNEDIVYGIAHLYFNGFANASIPNSLPVLIENYKDENPLFYFDNNNNLDFSDDGEPKMYSEDLLEVDKHNYRYLYHHLYLDEGKTKFGFVILKLSQEEKLNRLRSEMQTKRKEKVVSANYWIGYYPFNKVRGEMLRTQNIIELIDINSNLKYDDVDMDRVVFKNQNKVEKEFQDKWTVGESIILSIGEESYEITDLDSRGERITLQKVASQSQDLKLHIGDNANDLVVKSLRSKMKTIGQTATNNKKVLLYFWGSWCTPCKAILPELKQIYSQYTNELEIIAVAKDTPSKVKAYVKKNKISWQNVLATQSMLSSLNVTSYPTFILLDSNGVIMNEKVNLNEIENLVR